MVDLSRRVECFLWKFITKHNDTLTSRLAIDFPPACQEHELHQYSPPKLIIGGLSIIKGLCRFFPIIPRGRASGRWCCHWQWDTLVNFILIVVDGATLFSWYDGSQQMSNHRNSACFYQTSPPCSMVSYISYHLIFEADYQCLPILPVQAGYTYIPQCLNLIV